MNFNWNPVFNLVVKLKKEYEQLTETTSYNLLEMINFVNKSEYNDYFQFLDITQYEEYILLKYKSFIALNENEAYDYEDFWNKDNGFFQECRSLTINLKDEEIVLAPQRKFFNINERNGWELENIRKKISTAKKLEISSKLDGSNQNARWYKDSIFISGSSALDKECSWRLQETQKFLTDEYINMMKSYPDYTFMFEYISPKNQIVVSYTTEQEGLYLFGMRNVYTGKEKSYEEVIKIGKLFGVKTTDIFNKTLDDILGEVDKWRGDEKEGWVINIIDFNNNNFKAKLKVNDYVIVHRCIANLISPNSIIESIINNSFDDLLSKIPQGSRELALQYANEVCKYENLVRKKVHQYVSHINQLNRKDAMLWMDSNVPKDFLGYCKSEYLGRKWNCLKKSGDGHKKIGEIQKIIEQYKENF